MHTPPALLFASPTKVTLKISWVSSKKSKVVHSQIGQRLNIKKPAVDWEAVANSTQKLQGAINKYLDELTPEGKPPAVSVETALLGQEIRSDWEYGAKESHQPLRLLSLGTSLLHSSPCRELL